MHLSQISLLVTLSTINLAGARPSKAQRNSISGGSVGGIGLEETSFRILAGAGTDLFMLNFKPHTHPPSLSEEFRYDGVITNGAYPWISRHPENPNLFIVANDNHDQGELTSWQYDSDDGNLTLRDRVYSRGSCAHTAVSPDGSTVYVANLYGNAGQGSNAALIPIDSTTGTFGNVSVPSFLNFSDYQLQPGQLKDSQLMRHPHHWTFHPFLPVAYLSDLGADLVRRYHVVGPGEIIPLEPIQQSVATGPRRTIVHPSGEALYTLHEISSSISVGKIDTSTPYGNVTVTQTDVSLLKPNANTSANVFQGSEIQLSADGRFLYASSRNNTLPTGGSGARNDDAIALFSISENGTYIERLSFYSSGNWYLRYFALANPYLDQTLRGQRYLVSGGQMSNDTVIFERDLIDGSLTEVARYNSTGDSPTAYVWV